MKVWNRARIELVTPGSAVRLASVARHITDCVTQLGLVFDRTAYNDFIYVWAMKPLVRL